MSEKKPRRRGKGRPFQKGNKLSPGRPPIYQDYNERAKHLLETYTVEEVTGMVRAVAVPRDKRTAEDKKYHAQAKKMSARDFTILMSIANAFTSSGALPFASLLDRAIGKPVQHHSVVQTTTLVDAREKAEKDAEAMLLQLKKRREAAKTVH